MKTIKMAVKDKQILHSILMELCRENDKYFSRDNLKALQKIILQVETRKDREKSEKMKEPVFGQGVQYPKDLDWLFIRASKSGLISEVATLLGVSHHAIYAQIKRIKERIKERINVSI